MLHSLIMGTHRKSVWLELVCIFLLLISLIALETQAQPFTLSITKEGPGSGTVTSSSQDIDCGSDCSGSFSAGTTITLHAEPEPGSVFTGWVGDECADFGAEDCEFDIGEDTAVGANFDRAASETFKLTVGKTGAGKGTVASDPVGISCDAACSRASADFSQGQAVTLTATPEADSDFAGWGGCDTSTTTTCTIALDEDKTIAANFILKGSQTVQVNVTKDKTSTGTGKVTSTPSGIDCGSTCIFTFLKDTQVTLTATPDAGSIFADWGGACATSSVNTCTLNLTANKNITVKFDANIGPFTLRVARAGSARGLVTSVPQGINCGSTCSFNFNANTQVKLMANANSGHLFTGWSGACSGTVNSCTVTMDASKNVTATFSATTDLSLAKSDSPDPASTTTNITYTITITNDGPGSATGVKVTDPLPANVNFVSASASQGICSNANHTVQCTLGNVRADASARVTIVVKPTKEGNLTNTASVSSTTGDPNLSNNSATTTTTVGSPCANVTVSSQPASLVFNPSKTKAVRRNITVTILNRGSAARKVIAITPQAGEPFTIVSISPRLPATIRKGGSLRLIVLTQRAAGLTVATATRPYFDVTLDCGAYTSASDAVLPIPFALNERLIANTDQFEIQVFTLGGRLWVQRIGGQDIFSLPGATTNGVYLYVLSVRKNTGEVLYREVQKMVITR